MIFVKPPWPLKVILPKKIYNCWDKFRFHLLKQSGIFSKKIFFSSFWREGGGLLWVEKVPLFFYWTLPNRLFKNDDWTEMTDIVSSWEEAQRSSVLFWKTPSFFNPFIYHIRKTQIEAIFATLEKYILVLLEGVNSPTELILDGV